MHVQALVTQLAAQQQTDFLCELLETTVGKMLLRKFDDPSQLCRELAVAALLGGLQVQCLNVFY